MEEIAIKIKNKLRRTNGRKPLLKRRKMVANKPEEKKCTTERNDGDQIISEEITTKEEWKRVTTHVISDNHETTHRVQLQYRPITRPVDQNSGFLMVDDQGRVCTCGKKNYENTLFDIVHDFVTDRYKLICKGGKFCDYILYMDTYNLKIEKLKKKQTDTATYFSFRSRDNMEIPPWKISSFSGVPLEFDKNGQFQPTTHTHFTEQTNPYCFYAYTAHTMKYSAV